MEQIKNEIKSRVRIQYNECFEFARAIEYLCEGERKLMLPLELEISEIDTKIKKKFCDKVSEELKETIDWMYKNLNISGIVEAYTVDYHTSTVDELLYAIEGSDDVVFCNYVGGLFISKFKARYYRDWSDVKHSVELMKVYIKECHVIDDSARDNVVKSLEAPRDTRKKLIDGLRLLYREAYSKVKLMVEKQLANTQKKYMEQLFLTPIDFINKYFKNEFRIEQGSWKYRMTIHLSLFHPLGLQRLSIHNYIDQEGYVLLGKEAIQWYADVNQNKLMCQFLKVVSDETRMGILKELSIKASYGQELAGKLKLTPATIKHHLTLLEEAKLVTISKTEHKVYYALNKQIVSQCFDDIKNYLV